MRHTYKLVLIVPYYGKNLEEEPFMYEDIYSLALLKPEDLEEIREIEQRLSDKTGQSIALVAYKAEVMDGTPD
jgi:hypothetical protein